MALSEEALKMQLDILTSRTDQNADMVYKTNAILNKALNPDIFSGQNTKIVNAINLLAEESQQTNNLVGDITNKINEILLDTSNDANNAIWENVKDLMGKDTIIEGIEAILQGKQVANVLGLNASDQGKVLSIDLDDNGDPVLKAIDMIIDNAVNVADIKYVNTKKPNIQNVKSALDYLFDNIGSGGDLGGGLGGGTIIGEITWDMIDDRPEIPSKLQLISNNLALVNEDGVVLSSVGMMTDAEVDSLLDEMESN